MFCNMFSEISPYLLGEHGSCSTAQRPGELSENILQNLSNDLMNNPVCSQALNLTSIHRDGDEAADAAIDFHSAPGVREKAVALHGEILCSVR